MWLWGLVRYQYSLQFFASLFEQRLAASAKSEDVQESAWLFCFSMSNLRELKEHDFSWVGPTGSSAMWVIGTLTHCWFLFHLFDVNTSKLGRCLVCTRMILIFWSGNYPPHSQSSALFMNPKLYMQWLHVFFTFDWFVLWYILTWGVTYVLSISLPQWVFSMILKHFKTILVEHLRNKLWYPWRWTLLHFQVYRYTSKQLRGKHHLVLVMYSSKQECLLDYYSDIYKHNDSINRPNSIEKKCW